MSASPQALKLVAIVLHGGDTHIGLSEQADRAPSCWTALKSYAPSGGRRRAAASVARRQGSTIARRRRKIQACCSSATADMCYIAALKTGPRQAVQASRLVHRRCREIATLAAAPHAGRAKLSISLFHLRFAASAQRSASVQGSRAQRSSRRQSQFKPRGGRSGCRPPSQAAQARFRQPLDGSQSPTAPGQLVKRV